MSVILGKGCGGVLGSGEGLRSVILGRGWRSKMVVVWYVGVLSVKKKKEEEAVVCVFSWQFRRRKKRRLRGCAFNMVERVGEKERR